MSEMESLLQPAMCWMALSGFSGGVVISEYGFAIGTDVAPRA